jgi:anti-sigma B factor antagonist
MPGTATLSREVMVLRPQGELDVQTSQPLREQIQDSLRRGNTRLVVDLSEVTYVDSSALGVLVTGLKQARKANGCLKLCGLRGNVLRVFELTRLTKFFEIYETAEQAIKSF